jgi:UDP-glucuronate 4-epimerase
VPVTSADIQALMNDVGFRPDTPFQEGVQRFVDWYREYYHV